MTADDARDKLTDAMVRLGAEHTLQATEWRNLWIAIGRAMAALDVGDDAAARAALVDAEGLEYSLIGSCDITGAIVQALDGGALKEDPS